MANTKKCGDMFTFVTTVSNHRVYISYHITTFFKKVNVTLKKKKELDFFYYFSMGS